MNIETKNTVAPGEALRRLSIARAVVGRRTPYYGRLIHALRPVMSPGLGTVATTDDMVLLADPEVVGGKWTPEQIPGAYLHEVLHHALNHSARGKRMREGEGVAFNPTVWNIAADIECNRIIEQIGLALPDGCVFARTFKLPDNILAEVAYRRLMDEPPPPPPPQPQQGGGQPDQQPTFGGGRCGSCAGGEPVAGEELAPAEARASGLEKQAIEQAVAEAIVQAEAKARGSVPEEVLRQAQARLQPATVPWQQVLARHVRRATERRRGYRDWTFSRPSRRQSIHGVGPGRPIMPAPFEPVVEVAVVVDTSGSMSKAELETALAEIDGLLRSARNSIRVLSCDAAVHAQGRVTRASEVAKLLKGGGGTDFRPAFDALAPHRPGVTVVVTDGYGPAPEQAPAWTDTIWLLVGKHTRKPQRGDSWADINWGEFIRAGHA